MTSVLQTVDELKVVVCTGPGGVGKTTSAAALALALATQGRRVALITVDPARRLADALGLEALTNHPTSVALPRTVPGSVDAMMLDTRETFDDLVRRHAPSTAQGDRILANRFYQNIAGALGGTQEYMAMEKLHELVTAPRCADGTTLPAFDCVVVDTPPTKNALEFLSAPERLIRFLDNRVFRAMMLPARGGFRVVGLATQAVLRTLGKIVGGEVIADAVAFFQAFEGMEEGFRQRAAAVTSLLRAPTTGWIIVTSPREESVAEALFLVDQLVDGGVAVQGIIANRVQPSFAPLPVSASVAPELRAAVERAHAANELAEAHRLALAPLRERSGPFQELTLRATDVHDLAGLRELAASLAAT